MLPINATPFYTYLGTLISITLILSVFVLSLFYHVRRKRIQMKAKTFQDECMMEKHKKRIAADLHDDFGSLLTGLKLSLQEFSQTQPRSSLLQTSTDLLEQSIARLRDVSLNLVPPELERDGLHTAIEALVDRINAIGGIQVHYSSALKNDRFDPEKAMLIFRVIQELITNAIKHSGARKIEVGIAANTNRLLSEVRDDGIGFDYQRALSKKGSSGLTNIQSRLDLLNAVLMVQSDNGKGTHYFITIPVQSLRHGNR